MAISLSELPLLTENRLTTSLAPAIPTETEQGERASNRPLTFELDAMQFPPGGCIECIATMNQAPVVPNEDVAHSPLLRPGELRL